MSAEDLDTDGLEYLRWSMFDSPDSEGSAYRFMEREPVYILDRMVKRYRFNLNIELAYTSKRVADKMVLPKNSPHRIGRGVRLRCVGPKKRQKIIKALIEQGVNRIGVSKETVYFDTDDLKPYGFFLWN
jgi:hypothetical protein